MRKNTRNEKVLRAITIGIATMIAVTSTPVSVFAAEGEGGEGGEGPSSGSESTNPSVPQATDIPAVSESTGNTEQAVSEAQESFENAVETITVGDPGVSEENATPENPAASPVDPAAIGEGSAVAAIVVNEAINTTWNGITMENGTPVDFVNGNVIDGVMPVVSEENTNIGQAVLDNFTEANNLIELAKMNTATDQDDLGDAAIHDHNADIEAKNAYDDVDNANAIANEVKQTVDDAKNEAQGYKDTYYSENSDDAAKVEAYNNYDNLVNTTNTAVQKKKEEFEALQKQYKKAKENLENAEEKYNNSLDTAGANVGEAKENLQEAQAYVNELEEKIDAATKALKADDAAAKEIVKAENGIKTTDWTQQRNYVKSILKNYYISQVIDNNATDITVYEKDPGFDNQDGNAIKVTYKSGDETHTLYFNYDRADRQFKGNRYGDLGKELYDLVIYEKSEEEKAASDYIESYYRTLNTNSKDFRDKLKAGGYDIYSFTDENGERVFKVQDEINEAIKTGEITKDNDGNYFLNEIKGKLVEQTTSQTVEEKGLRSIRTTDENFKEFVNNAGQLYEKYKEYDDRVEEAKTEVKEAVTAAGDLQDAIDALHRDNRISKFAQQELIADIIDQLDSSLSEEDRARLQEAETTKDAIKILDEILDNAEKKIEEAQNELKEITDERDKIKKELYPETPYTPPYQGKDDGIKDEPKEEPAQEDPKEDSKEDPVEIPKDDIDDKPVFDYSDDPVEDTKKVPVTPSTPATGDTPDFVTPDGPSDDLDDGPSDGGTTPIDAPVGTTPIDTPDGTTPFTIPGIVPDGTPVDAPAVPFTPIGGGTGITPIIPGGSGVAGVNLPAAAQISGLFEDANDYNEKLAQAKNTVNDVKTQVEQGKKIVKINEDEVPLAALPTEDGVRISWWWLLIILLLGEMGREMYKKHKEKMEAAKVEANKTNE